MEAKLRPQTAVARGQVVDPPDRLRPAEHVENLLVQVLALRMVEDLGGKESLILAVFCGARLLECLTYLGRGVAAYRGDVHSKQILRKLSSKSKPWEAHSLQTK